MTVHLTAHDIDLMTTILFFNIKSLKMRTDFNNIILLIFVSTILNTSLQAQYYPDGEIDTSGLVIEIVPDGLDTVFYFGDEETIDTAALRLTYSGYHDANTYQAKIGLTDSTI